MSFMVKKNIYFFRLFLEVFFFICFFYSQINCLDTIKNLYNKGKRYAKKVLGFVEEKEEFKEKNNENIIDLNQEIFDNEINKENLRESHSNRDKSGTVESASLPEKNLMKKKFLISKEVILPPADTDKKRDQEDQEIKTKNENTGIIEEVQKRIITDIKKIAQDKKLVLEEKREHLKNYIDSFSQTDHAQKIKKILIEKENEPYNEGKFKMFLDNFVKGTITNSKKMNKRSSLNLSEKKSLHSSLLKDYDHSINNFYQQNNDKKKDDDLTNNKNSNYKKEKINEKVNLPIAEDPSIENILVQKKYRFTKKTDQKNLISDEIPQGNLKKIIDKKKLLQNVSIIKTAFDKKDTTIKTKNGEIRNLTLPEKD